jgi:hypothetical protein
VFTSTSTKRKRYALLYPWSWKWSFFGFPVFVVNPTDNILVAFAAGCLRISCHK